jgi:hypothetical protein
MRYDEAPSNHRRGIKLAEVKEKFYCSGNAHQRLPLQHRFSLDQPRPTTSACQVCQETEFELISTGREFTADQSFDEHLAGYNGPLLILMRAL